MAYIVSAEVKLSLFNVNTTATIALCALCSATGAAAEGLLKIGPSVFNYNYVEIKYVDVDGGDGFSLVGSGDIKQNIALQVEYSQFGSGFADVDLLQFGGSYYIQSQSYPAADWVFAAGIENFSSGSRSSDSGIYASAGTRYAVNNLLEINAALQLSTAGDTDLNLSLAALYELSPGLSFLVETDLGDDSTLGIGARFYWR